MSEEVLKPSDEVGRCSTPVCYELLELASWQRLGLAEGHPGGGLGGPNPCRCRPELFQDSS